MKSRLHLRKIHLLTFIICICTAFMYMFSSAHAASLFLEGGTSGSCIWKYEEVDGDKVLTIAPTNGREGTLGLLPFDNPLTSSWGSSPHKEDTKRVMVKGKVKVEPSAEAMFRDFRQAESMDLSGLDITDVRSTRAMFCNCCALTTLDMSRWNVSNVTDMECMFAGCSTLASLDVNNWNVSKVTDMGFMFYNNELLASLDVSSWNVSGVTSMKSMFRGCAALTSLDVSKWNVSNVTNMDVMFAYCRALTSLDVSNWNVSSVTSMHSTFFCCEFLASLDVCRWNVSGVTNMRFTFFQCSALTLLDVSSWDVSSAMNMEAMFAYCSALTQLDVSSWNVSSAVNTRCMFYDDKSLASLDVSRWNVSRVRNMESMFYCCKSLTSLDVSRWNVSNVTFRESMFFGCSALTSLDLCSWKATPKTKMKDMFANTQSLRQISLGNDFYIKDDAAFDDAGSQVGTKWMQVNLSEGGTHNDPKNNVFESSSDLLAFHQTRTKTRTGRKEYIRVAPAKLTVIFNKGADDATGEMTSEFYDVGTAKMLPKNVYRRDGYVFRGWRDSAGNVYTDEQVFENNYFGQVMQNKEVLQRTLELVAQWKAILTYKVKGGTGDTLSHTREELDQSCDPAGSEVMTRVPEGKEVMWTVEKGGNEGAFLWSHKGAQLGADEIKVAALTGGEFLSTTFIAELVDKTYTITFDAGVPFGTEVRGLPGPIAIKHGQEARIPTRGALSCPGYQFTGVWNDDKDGAGASYRAGSKIKNIFSHVTLHAQWRAILTYKVEEGAGINLSRFWEEVDLSCNPLGSAVIGRVPENKEVMWTVHEGGGDAASEWSYKGEQLETDEIEKVALKDRKFVPTTFQAELVDRFYAITFDANAPFKREVKGLPSSIVVKHGQKAQIPSDITLSCPNCEFTGEWNDDRGGVGASYRAGNKIRNVFSHMTLYAQWKRTTTFVSEAKKRAQFSSFLQGEAAGSSDDLLGSEAAAEVLQEKKPGDGKRQASETAPLTRASKRLRRFHTSGT